MTDTRSHTPRGAVALNAAGLPDGSTALDIDALDVFRKLVREVDAGMALVTMTPAGEQRRAALDALALARCVLDDARELLDDEPAGLRLLSDQLDLPRRFRGIVTVNRCDVTHTGPRCPEDHT